MQLSQGSERAPFAGVRLAGSVEVGTIRRERASGGPLLWVHPEACRGQIQDKR